MSTLYGSQATKVLNTAIPKLVEQGYKGGSIKCISDKYDLSVAAATLLTGDIIRMGGKIPEGARIVNFKLIVPDLDSGSSVLLSAGWLASDDAVEAVNGTGFASSITTGQAGGVYDMFVSAPTATGMQKVFSAEVQPTVTCTLQGSSVVTGVIYMEIEYVID